VTTSLLPCFEAKSITPEQASSSYDAYAPGYDALDGGSAATALGIDRARAELIRLARGDVLEVGVGTGLNLPYYSFGGEDGVASLAFADVSEGMLQQTRAKSSLIPKSFPLTYTQLDATSQLVETFGKSVFDTVIDTFSLCVMGNEGAKKCLKQMKHVVKNRREGGRILLLENSRASNPLLGWYQDLTAETAASTGGKGCLYNQDVGSLIRDSGLVIEREMLFAGGLFRSFVCFVE